MIRSKPSVFFFFFAGLKLGTHYELTLLAFNDLGESDYNLDGIVAKTSSEYGILLGVDRLFHVQVE